VIAPPVPLPDWSAHWNAGRLETGGSDATGAGDVAALGADDAAVLGLLRPEIGCGGDDDAHAVATKIPRIPIRTDL
jgi:hypothetical protein